MKIAWYFEIIVRFIIIKCHRLHSVNGTICCCWWHGTILWNILSLLLATGILGEIIFLLYFFISYVLHWLCCACLSHLIFCIKSVCVCVTVYFCYLFTTQNQDVVTEIILIFSCDRSEKRKFYSGLTFQKKYWKD